MASIFRRGRRGTWWIKYRVGERQIHHSLHTTNERVAITTTPRCPECGKPFNEADMRLAWRPTVFPITTWHPLSTSPIAGGLVGVSTMLLVLLIAEVLGYRW